MKSSELLDQLYKILYFYKNQLLIENMLRGQMDCCKIISGISLETFFYVIEKHNQRGEKSKCEIFVKTVFLFLSLLIYNSKIFHFRRKFPK